VDEKCKRERLEGMEKRKAGMVEGYREGYIVSFG
jgi:hypothetical protein